MSENTLLYMCRCSLHGAHIIIKNRTKTRVHNSAVAKVITVPAFTCQKLGVI